MKSRIEIASGQLAALDNVGALTSRSSNIAAAPTALLVPGYTGSKEDFLPLLRPLAAAGIRAVSIDQRGQYESTWSADPSGYRIEALAADLLDVAGRLEGSGMGLHLVGHSFGGLVARAAVLAKPELFRSLTLMGSGPAAIAGPRLEVLRSGEPILAEHGMEALWEHLASVSRPDEKYAKAPESVLRFLRTRFLANDPLGLKVMGDEIRSEPDRTDELAAVRLPILVLHGEADDAWLPSLQREMALRLGADYVVIPEAAHSPATENPSVTADALIRFWGGTDRAQSGL